MRSRIVGTGRALPPKVLTNLDLEKMVDTSDAWITERTGIKERRVLDRSLATSDLATEAGQRACKAAGVDPDTID
jgi:3-oxoacyl-[acyl-carrier-protein] synthase-3